MFSWRTDRYHLLDLLGQGSMGTVYRALDRLTGQQVALKQVRFRGLMQVDSGDFRLAITEEFSTLAALRHPNIISVLDYGFDDDQQPYFTMDELVGAVNVLEAARGRDRDAIVDLIMQMLEALAYLHRRSVIHCDLKPDNVLVTPEGQVKLLDFGIALTRERMRGDDDDGISGTLEYIAPEVIQGEIPSAASDLYAVGIMLFEMLVGHHPFDRANVSQLITDTLNKRPDLTPLIAVPELAPLATVVARLLSKHPDDRYRDAASVQRALATAMLRPAPAQSVAVRESFLQAAEFVGRESELARLIDALNAALDGRGSAWLIGGESGVGKSRLLSEVRARALVAGALVLGGQAVSSGGQPLQVWRDPVRRLLLSVPVTPLEAGVLRDLVPDIQTLIDVEVEDVPPLDGRAQLQRLNQTIAALFRRHARATVLMLEDLHWSGDLETLKQVLMAVDDLPLLVLATYRDDDQPDLPTLLPDMQVMLLRRLNPEQIELLAESMIGELDLTPQFVAFLHQQTEGNVLFLIEVMRALAEESGGLEAISERTLPHRIVAGGMMAVIRRRLDHVPRAARPALKLAAAIGREIQPNLMRAAFPDLDLDRWLTQCAEASVLEAVERKWWFAHDKLRDVLLADIPEEEARHLHRQAALAFEALYGDDPDQAFALAEHWDRAGDADKTRQYSRLAGERALTICVYQDARRLLARALELTPEQPTRDDDIDERAVLLKLMGEVYTRTSEYSLALDCLNQSAELARRHGLDRNLAEALASLSFVYATEEQIDAAERYAEEARLLAEAGQYDAVLAQVLNNLGMVAESRMDFPAARQHYQESLLLNTVLGNKRGMAAALNNLGSIADTLGDYVSARDLYSRSLTLCEEICYLLGVAVILNNLGILAERLSDDVIALSYFERSAALSREIGSRRGETTALINSVFMLLGENRARDAVTALRRAVANARIMQSTHMLALVAVAEARLNLTLGQVVRAAEALEMALAAAHFDVDFHTLRVQPLIDELAEVLTEDEREAARLRAKGRSLHDLFNYVKDGDTQTG